MHVFLLNMKTTILVLMLLLGLRVCSYAQASDSTIIFDSTYFASIKKPSSFTLSRNGHTITGLEYINKMNWGIRANLSYGTDWIQGSLLSTALTRDNAHDISRVSTNSLVALPWLAVAATLNPHTGGNPDWLLVTGFLLTLPQIVPNLTITAPIITNHFYLGISQRTDYYLLNSPVRVYTESSVVARIFVYRIGAEIRYSFPITKGFLEDKRPYIGGSLNWVF